MNVNQHPFLVALVAEVLQDPFNGVDHVGARNILCALDTMIACGSFDKGEFKELLEHQ